MIPDVLHTIEHESAKLDYMLGPGRIIEISSLVTLDRRKGHATAALDKLLQLAAPFADTIYVKTRLSLRIAQQFYSARGFKLAAAIADFYDGDSADARTMLLYVRRLRQ